MSSATAITDFLDYTTKTPGARSRTYRVQVSPNTGAQTLSPGDVARFDAPCGRGKNVFLDPSQSYISFQVVNNDTAQDIVLDGSAYCFFNRMDELSSGQLISTILDYNACVQAVLDAQMPGADAVVSGSVAMGFAGDDAVNCQRLGLTIPKTKTADFCLPIALSGLLSGLCPKLVPVGLMPDYRLELTLETASQAVYASTAPTAGWTMKSILLNLFYLDLDPQVADMLYQANGGQYKISTEFYRSFATLTGSGQTSDAILVPIRVSSLKTMLVFYRFSSDLSSYATLGISNRANPWADSTKTGKVCSVQWSVGSVLEPNQPIKYGISELYTMLLQSQHSLGSVTHFNRHSYLNWQANSAGIVAGAGASPAGSAIAGINFETFIFKTKTITCGINSLTSPVFFQTSYPSAIASAQRIVSLCHYDALVTISDQGVDVRF